MPKRLGVAVFTATTALVAAQLVGVASASARSVGDGGPAGAGLTQAAAPAIGTPQQVSSGQARLVGATSSAQHLRLTIGLKTPHQAEEDAFVASLKDKNSPNFRHFLTAAQWNARFAPSAADEQAVVDWARSNDLTVTKRYANRLIVDVDSTVGAIDNALGVRINNYRLGSTSFYSNAKTVSLPSKIADVVQSISGLNSLQQLKPASTPAAKYPNYSPGAVHRFAGSKHANGSKALLAKAMARSKAKLARQKAHPNTTNGFYDPTDLYSDQAYSVNALDALGHCCNPTHNAGGTPAATSIAISTVGSVSGSDITGFHNQYPYLAEHYFEHYIDGTPACCGDESTLDLEWSLAMANSFGSYTDTASVVMYEGANAALGTFTDIWNAMLSDNLARTMSSSWGCAESYCYDAGTMNTDHGIFDSMLGQGWTLMTASDDKGAYADCSHVSVEYPASDPDVLSVGGTDLQAAGTFQSETAWIGATYSGACSHNGGGGGGGCSVQWSLPSYQSGRIANLCSTRAEPDVSLNAGIGQNYYFNGSLQPTGGTSIATPEYAGIWAQINAILGSLPSAACSGGCTTVGQAGPDVYNSSVAGPQHPYYDITSGCTTNDVGSGYCGIVGYDRATGLGSANLYQLALGVLYWNVIEASAPTITMSGPPTSTYTNSGEIDWSIVDNGTGAPTGVQGYTAQWDADPGNVTTEPHGGSGNNFWDGPAAKNQSSGSASISGAGEGCHTLFVRSWDNIGESSLNSYGPVCYDGTSPTVTAPITSFVTGKTVDLSTKAAPVLVHWTASDNLSGLSNNQLYKSVDNGTFVPVSLSSPTATQVSLTLAPQHTYRFVVGTYDAAGNFSGYAYAPTFTLTSFPETAAAVTYSSGWQSQSSASALGGTTKYSTAAGRTATFSYIGSKVLWVAPTGPTRGSATVAIDGGTAKTVNTHPGTTTMPRRTVFAAGTSAGKHTLVITNLATAGHQRVDVDAFYVMK